MKFIRSGAPSSGEEDQTSVERNLVTICKKLAQAEVNVKLFSKMVQTGVATGDVRGFVENQANLNKENNQISVGLTKRAMKQKLRDALVTASRLRQKKRRVREVLKRKFNLSESKCKKIMKKAMALATNHRVNFQEKI